MARNLPEWRALPVSMSSGALRLEAKDMLSQGEPDLRRHPRAKVIWPVTIVVEGETLQTETIDLGRSAPSSRAEHGAHTRGVGSPLSSRARESFDVDAIGGVDPDGDAFFFTSSEERLVATRAADQYTSADHADRCAVASLRPVMLKAETDLEALQTSSPTLPPRRILHHAQHALRDEHLSRLGFPAERGGW